MASPSAPSWQTSKFPMHLILPGKNVRACGKNATPATNQVATVTCPECLTWMRYERERVLTEEQGMGPPAKLDPGEIVKLLERLEPDDERAILMILLDRRFARSEKREAALAKAVDDLEENFRDIDRRLRNLAGG